MNFFPKAISSESEIGPFSREAEGAKQAATSYSGSQRGVTLCLDFEQRNLKLLKMESGKFIARYAFFFSSSVMSLAASLSLRSSQLNGGLFNSGPQK